MKRILLVIAALAMSSSAFASAGGPIRQGDKCWAAVDQRGFGFWDECADPRTRARRNRQDGIYRTFDRSRTVIGGTIGNSAGGGGAGGGGNGR